MARETGKRSWLDRIEWLGNKLPEPSTLFLIGAFIVLLLSQIVSAMNVEVTGLGPKPVLDAAGQAVLNPDGTPKTELVEQTFTAKPLLTADGIYWALSSMVKNFINFPPLGVVLVGMLGIGVAERTGLIAAMLKAFLRLVPERLLDPAMVFLGVMSSMTSDAGYVVLPPLAMALYKAVGRSPLVGLAAVFAGVAAGFNANLFVTGLDPMLAQLSTVGAQVIDPAYKVSPTCNWWFMAVSTLVITMTGWAVSAKIVEPRYRNKPADEGGPAEATDADQEVRRMTAIESRGLAISGGVFIVLLGLTAALTLVPGWPLHGEGEHFARWVEAIVPILFLLFLIPAIVYGYVVKSLQNEKDAARMMVEAMASMAPILVLSFFAAQFIAYFNESNLGRMLAISGGEALSNANMHPMALVVAFIVVTLLFNLLIGSMSAKYTLFAPIFVPMFMVVGISPELTQAAYRIGDSVTNIITPLNAYLVIILVAMRRYVPKAGMGTLISTMLPYSIWFTVVWTVLMLAWMALGIPLGPGGPLTYEMAR